MAQVERHADRRRVDPPHEVAHEQRRVTQQRHARIDRRAVLERDHQPGVLGARGKPPQRALLRQQPILDAIGRSALGDRQARRVVHDVRGTHGDRVVEQAVERGVVLWLAESQVLGA